MTRLRALLRGTDRVERPALPLGELLDPLALAAVAALAVNDRLLKGHAPGWLTGKLSDVAGLVFAPLLATAVVDCALALAFRLGADVDPSLRRRKLALAALLVGVGFAAVELVPSVTELYLAALHRLGFAAVATLDPGDLVALPALALAWWIGRAEIARVPLHRLAVVVRRAGADPARAAAELADVRALAARPAEVDALAAALADHAAAPGEATRRATQAALDRLG